MDAYLNGFIDGYNKAIETDGDMTIDAKKIAEKTYDELKEIDEKRNRIKGSFKR